MDYDDFRMIGGIPDDFLQRKFGDMSPQIARSVQERLFGEGEKLGHGVSIEFDIEHDTGRLVFVANLSGGDIQWTVDAEKSMLEYIACVETKQKGREHFAQALEDLAAKIRSHDYDE